VNVLREVSYVTTAGIQLLKLSVEICMVPLQTSFEEVVAYTGSIDLLKVTEIVLLTETSAAPSSGETAVTVGADVSVPAVSVDSSSSSLLEQETERVREHSRVKNRTQILRDFRSTKPPHH
tara:strand:- start:427 stop:789 length:363 start_codon:yes stop_codon:yes gene_type:complete